MKIEIITDIEELGKYKFDWNYILKDIKNTNPFIEFDWIYTWWKTFGNQYELFVIAVKHEEEVVAFFPCMKKKKMFLECIYFIGYRQANYMDVIAYHQWSEQAIEFVLNILLSTRKKRLIYLHGLIESGHTFSKMIHVMEMNHFIWYKASTIAPFVNIKKINPSQYFQRRKKKDRLDRKEKNLNALGFISYESLKAKDIEKIFFLHTKRWQEKNDTSSFSKGKTKDFFIELFQNKSLTFKTRIDVLYLENQILAFIYGFECRNHYLFYLSAHDDDFGMYSPGKLILKEKIKECIYSRVLVCDMSIGDEPYKMDWCNDVENVAKVIFPSRSLWAYLYYILISNKDRFIVTLKKNRKIVHFKRNTLGKWKANLLKIRRNGVNNVLKLVIHTLSKKRRIEEEFILYQKTFEDITCTNQEIKWRIANFKDIEKLANKGNIKIQKLIHRLYKKNQCYVTEYENKIKHSFWLNSAEINIQHLKYQERLSKGTAYLYDIIWDEQISFEFLAESYNIIYIAVNKKDKPFISNLSQHGFVLKKELTSVNEHYKN